MWRFAYCYCNNSQGIKKQKHLSGRVRCEELTGFLRVASQECAAEAYKTSELSYNHLEGALKTARLRAVPNWELDEEYCWAGDLNTTLQHLNEKMAKRRMTEVEYESEMSTSEEIEEEEEEENAERPMILLDTDEDEDEEYGEDDEDEEYSEYDEDEEYGEDDEDEEDDGEDDDIHSY
ncbi:hypothetical protein CUMW_189370 [Citrus unshiu]|uniref:Uncharacterized protein n=1 Tax=Citrus unshiu TaxID=55188 RepID=A0A2H5Q289_CITUN|nr:hypothetical protein CUMW_189370 [Citrus unshiu]